MSTGTCEIIEPFALEEYNALFSGAYVFSGFGRNFLLNKDGYSILLDDELLEEIEKKEIEEALAVVLIQHRFLKLQSNDGPLSKNNSERDNIHPVFFMIDLTNRCNMACRYCLRESEDSADSRVLTKDMAIEICDYILKYCEEEKEDKITIQPWGGEPLLERNTIFFIQDYLLERGIDACISIETNGLLLSEAVLQELAERNIWVSVSIDGPEMVHNQQRVFRDGSPTHSVVEANLIRLRDKYQGQVSVIATLTKNSSAHVKEIVNYLVKELALQNIKVNYVHKSSFVENEDLCMSVEEIAYSSRAVFDAVLEVMKEGYKTADYNIYTKMSNLINNPAEDSCISNGCHGGRRMIVFNEKGDIYPCDVTDYPEEKIGNIKENRTLINTIEEAMSAHGYFIEKKEPKCDNCPWYCFCRGGCTVHVKTQGLEPTEVDPIECTVNKTLYPLLVHLILAEPETVNLILQKDVL